jgi:putative ABC transport system permease protein
MTLNEFKESLRLAFGTFRAHKLRSFLTILGVLVGVFTIIAVVSVITGLNNSIARDIESMGSNTLYVSKYKPGIVMGNRPASERIDLPPRETARASPTRTHRLFRRPAPPL